MLPAIKRTTNVGELGAVLQPMRNRTHRIQLQAANLDPAAFSGILITGHFGVDAKISGVWDAPSAEGKLSVVSGSINNTWSIDGFSAIVSGSRQKMAGLPG